MPDFSQDPRVKAYEARASREAVSETVEPITIMPSHRLMPARDRRQANYTINYHKVWFPHVKFEPNTRLSTFSDLSMSADGENWIPAYFPHVSHGWPSGCMQYGKFIFDVRDPLASITDYVVGYVSRSIKYFWRGLFHVEVESSSAGVFMQGWEKCSLDDILEYVDLMHQMPDMRELCKDFSY